MDYKNNTATYLIKYNLYLCVYHSILVASHIQLFATPWTVAHQGSLSKKFSGQEYWSGLPFPSPENLPNPGMEPVSPASQVDSLPSEPPGHRGEGCSLLFWGPISSLRASVFPFPKVEIHWLSGQGGTGVWLEGFAVATIPKVKAVCPVGSQRSPPVPLTWPQMSQTLSRASDFSISISIFLFMLLSSSFSQVSILSALSEIWKTRREFFTPVGEGWQGKLFF